MKHLPILLSLTLFSCSENNSHEVCAKAIEIKVSEADSLQTVINSLTSELKDCKTQAKIMVDILQDDADRENFLAAIE